jgi:hypothetical protein
LLSLSFLHSLSQIRSKFSEIYGLSPDALRFEFDGERLGPEDTPDSLEMSDDDLIDVKVRCCVGVILVCL